MVCAVIRCLSAYTFTMWASFIHIFMKNNDGSITLCTRLFAKSERCVWHEGRVIAGPRGKGVGIMIMEATAEVTKKAKEPHACAWKGRQGLLASTRIVVIANALPPFDEAGIPHFRMEMRL